MTDIEMETMPDRVVDAIYRQIRDHLTSEPDLRIEKNTALPEEMRDKERLIIIRDGDPGEPEMMLGGFRQTFYSHRAEIEMFSASASRAVRDQRFSNLKALISAALETDITLGGLVQGMDFGAPAPVTEYAGGPDIKSATLPITVDYQADTPLG